MGEKRENEVWKIVYKKRKRRKKIDTGIDMEKWREHFMRLLRGVECRVIRGEECRRRKDDLKSDIDREEIRRVIGKIKNRKAERIDGISNKTWKYGRGELKEWIWDYCDKI